MPVIPALPAKLTVCFNPATKRHILFFDASQEIDILPYFHPTIRASFEQKALHLCCKT